MPRGVSRRAELLPRARQLQREGKTAREIGEQLGVARSTVSEWCSDPERRKHAARRAAYRGDCHQCGAATDGSDGPGRAKELCATCSLERLHDGVRARSASIRREVEQAWADGLKIREIAQRLGWSANAMSAFIVKARREGAALPYRNRTTLAGRAAQRKRGRDAAARLAQLRSAA